VRKSRIEQREKQIYDGVNYHSFADAFTTDTKESLVRGMKKQELRSTIHGSQLRASQTQDGSRVLRGYAAVFNSPTNIGGLFTEQIAPGAFSRTLAEDDQVMLRDHKSELLLARRSAGTLTLTQDNIGLAFQVTLPNTSLGQDTYENVRLGNLKGCSFMFIPREEDWSYDTSGNLLRSLIDVQCAEVTLTAFPQYDSTSVDIRSVRSKLAQRDDSDDDSEDDDYRPECDESSDDFDEDADCETDDLDEEDSTRADKLRVRMLFDSRQRLNSTQ
jgi:uncharacterized protein